MLDRGKQTDAYQRKRNKYNVSMIIIGVILLVGIFLISMNTGYSKLSPSASARALVGLGTEKEELILFGLRLPRILLSLLVGAGLALSGCVIQSVTKKPLADPGLLGINAGAGLMVILYVLLFKAQSFLSVFTLPFLALVGAGGAAIGIYMLSYKKGEGISPSRLVLNGIAMQAGITSLTTVCTVKLDSAQFDFVAKWQAGSIWGNDWKFVLTLFPWLLLCIPYVFMKSRMLDVLNLGDEVSCGLGVAVEKERKKLLGAAVVLAGTCVAVSGSISFVGLIAPHLAKRLVGPRHALLIPCCLMIGAALLSCADMIARVIIEPSEIPAGVVVAILGAPYFLYLLHRNKGLS